MTENKELKKLTALALSVAMIMGINANVFAIDATESSAVNRETISFVSQDGDNIHVATDTIDDNATAKVYVNGVLAQKSVANGSTKSIVTEVYDKDETSSRSSSGSTSYINDFVSTTIHKETSLETIDIARTVSRAASIYDEPVDNTGLSSSSNGDGYYFLGSAGGYYYAPDVYGYLFRDYTRTYDGETHYWSWGAGDTLSAIGAYISLFGGPVNAIIGILVFTGSEVLMYNQSVNLETYTFDYNYKVRVYGDEHFTTNRNITYWKISNTTTNATKWDQKSFNYGFSMNNGEMIKAGIDNYLS